MITIPYTVRLPNRYHITTHAIMGIMLTIARFGTYFLIFLYHELIPIKLSFGHQFFYDPTIYYASVPRIFWWPLCYWRPLFFERISFVSIPNLCLIYLTPLY